MADAEQQTLDAATFACHAVVRIYELSPEEFWEAIKPETRRWWLDLAGQPMGYRKDGWNAIPGRSRTRLQLTMQQVCVFLTGAGLDLSGLRG